MNLNCPVILALLTLTFTQMSSATKGVCKIIEDGENVLADCSNIELEDMSDVLNFVPPNITALDLSRNHISQLPYEGYKRLKNLRRLTLSHQGKKNITLQKSFTDLQSLEELDLSDNCFCYTRSPFKNLRNLKVLNISQMSPCHPEKYPDILEDLPSTLNTLYISKIPEAFNKMENLQNLILTGPKCNLNTLTNETFYQLQNSNLTKLVIRDCNVKNIEPSTFIHLPYLEQLSISCSEVKIDDVLDAIENLPETVMLETLIMDGLGKSQPHFFGISLPTDGEFVANCSHIPALHNLKRLSMRGSNIATIDLELLTECFSELEYVALGYNSPNKILPTEDKFRHPFSTAERFLNVAQVKTLDLSHLFGGGGNYYREQFCKYFVDVEDNFRPDMFPTNDTEKYSTGLQYLYADNMLMAMTQYGPHTMIKSYTKSRVKVIDLSFNTIKYAGKFSGFTELRILNMSNNHIESIAEYAFAEENKMEKIDFRYNSLGQFDFKNTFVHLTHLKFLDIAYNEITVINQNAFNDLTSLEILRLGDNQLFRQQDSLHELFRNLKNLRELDLQWNRITSLRTDSFSKLTNLRVLNLLGNAMFIFNTNLTYLVNLEFLNLDKNHLEEIDHQVAKDLDCMEHPIARKNKITIRLTDSGLKCRCSSLSFFEWMEGTKTSNSPVRIEDIDNLKCTQDNGQGDEALLSQELIKLRNTCGYRGDFYACKQESFLFGAWRLILKSAASGAGGTTIVLTIVTIIMHFWQRMVWKAYHLWWYQTEVGCRRRRRQHPQDQLVQENTPTEVIFDGFVVYNKHYIEDVDFVENILLPGLRNEFKLCVLHHTEDFPNDQPMSLRIIKGIVQSRKLIIVVSPKFLESKWCQFSVRMATVYRGRGHIVCCYREKVNYKKACEEVKIVLQYTDYARYPRRGDSRWRTYEQCLERFWELTPRRIRAKIYNERIPPPNQQQTQETEATGLETTEGAEAYVAAQNGQIQLEHSPEFRGIDEENGAQNEVQQEELDIDWAGGATGGNEHIHGDLLALGRMDVNSGDAALVSFLP